MVEFPVHDPRNDEKVMVYPTHENSAKALRHPIDGALSEEGSLWTKDGLTARLLIDGSITEIKEHGWRSGIAPNDPTVPPAHATQTPVAVPDNPPTVQVQTRKEKGLQN